MDVKVFDAQGVERDWAWAVDRYGVELVEAIPPEGATVFRLSEVRQKVGPCGMTVKVVDEEGQALEGIAVLQGWVDGPELPANAAPRLTLTFWKQPDNKPNRGNGGFTNVDGVMGWGWGPGEQYQPPNGPHWYWIMPGEQEWFTDVILGLGWLWGTDHDTLTLTFTREVGEEPDPDPDPDPEPGDLEKNVEAIRTSLERIEDILETVFRVG